jgi:hypothetical protein
MPCKIETSLMNRPKGRAPIWVVRVFDDGALAFSSDTKSIRFRSEDDAKLLGRAIATALDAGAPIDRSDIVWAGDLSDDCTAEIGRFGAHAEHLHGPRRGGLWYCQVYGVFHSADWGIVPRNGNAARWLCELVASAAECGFEGFSGVGGPVRSPFLKLRRNRGAFRTLGGAFAVIGSLLSTMGGYMLHEPTSTLLYNGVETNSPSAKLQFMLAGLVGLALGLLILFAPRRFLDRVLILQRRAFRRTLRGRPDVA